MERELANQYVFVLFGSVWPQLLSGVFATMIYHLRYLIVVLHGVSKKIFACLILYNLKKLEPKLALYVCMLFSRVFYVFFSHFCVYTCFYDVLH